MPLVTTFDPLFSRYAGNIPVTYLRALAKKESNFNPSNATGPAWGLMQITEVVRESYNKRHGTSYSRSDLLNPTVNVAMATDLLNRIQAAYAKHPAPNMRPNWRNPEYVKLVTAGWNSGYSEGGGVGRVARWLHERGIPVTHDNVFKYAGAAGATIQLQRPEKAAWQRQVADLFYAEGGPGGGAKTLLYAGILVGAIYLAYRQLS